MLPEQNSLRGIEQQQVPLGAAEQRIAVEEAVGIALAETFEHYSDLVQRDEETGAERLELYKEWKAHEWADIHLTRYTDEVGVRTTALLRWAHTNGGWGSAMLYEEVPGKPGRLLAATIDHEAMIIVPAERPEPFPNGSMPHDPTRDANIVFAGKVWPENLRGAHPDRSRPDPVGAFAKRGIRLIMSNAVIADAVAKSGPIVERAKEKAKPIVADVRAKAEPLVEWVGEEAGKRAKQVGSAALHTSFGSAAARRGFRFKHKIQKKIHHRHEKPDAE